MKTPLHILPLIIISQFADASLWFVGNAILPDIQKDLDLYGNAVGNITSIVQFGFIAGTLVFSIFAIADRFSSSKVFFVSSLIASIANVSIAWVARDVTMLFSLRFITGFFLAGIYPVGMKIAADWYDKGLGKAMGYLLGALVLGTALPYLLKSSIYSLPWKQVLLFTSIFALFGGLLMLFIGDGPYRKLGNQFQPSAMFRIFRSADFRSAAFGYFGHMWELYTFWAFVPVILEFYISDTHASLNVPLWAFLIIAIGGLGCVAGGYLSQRGGSARVAFYALLCSGLCCLISPAFSFLPLPVFIFIMLLWGSSVITDSPQFSTLIAQTAIPEYKGTALTIVTSVGFAITIGSLQLIHYIFSFWTNSNSAFVLLAPGPLFGLVFLLRLVGKKNKDKSAS